MKIKLGDIADIFYGPFQKAQMKGGVKYLVASHFDEYLQPALFKDSYIDESENMERYLLTTNDVILTGKGLRLFAWNFKSSFGPAVPSSLFYTLRLERTDKVLPQYLEIFLNLDKTNSKLKSLSKGTSIPSIQKGELQNLKIKLPSLENQKQIILISNIINRDIDLTQQLLEKKTILKKGILNELVNNKF